MVRIEAPARSTRVLSAFWIVFVLAAAQAQTPPVPTPRALPDFTELVDRVGPAVVNIRTTERVSAEATGRGGLPGMPDLDENDPLYEFFRRFFPPQQPGPTPRQAPRRVEPQEPQEVPRGIGSGFVLTADGYVMTNAHVVQGADEVYVTLPDKREFKAKIVGVDKRSDVALVKVDAKDLPRVVIGDAAEVRAGQWVVAIGSPFGLDSTVTAGIVSAKSRDTGDLLPLIQTDVAVNPGNSGGPLLNMKGEVIGINSQIYSRTGGFMGISFAIPIDEAMRVADQLRSTGHVSRGRIGVGIDDLSKELADALGVKQAGVVVRLVDPGSPADKGGIEPGDIVLKWQGRPTDRPADLRRAVANTKPGTAASAQIWRKGQLRDVTLTVAELETDRASAPASKSAPSEKAKPRAETNTLGVVVGDLPESRRAELRIKSGVQVDVAEGAASRAGVMPGDVIVSINNADATSAKQFNDIVSKLDKSKAAVLLLRRGDTAQYATIKPQSK